MAEAAGCVLDGRMNRGWRLLQGLDLLGHNLPLPGNLFNLLEVLWLLQILSLTHALDLPVKSAQSVAQLAQFFFLCLSPSAAFIPVNSKDPLIFPLTIGLGDQGIVDLLRVYVTTAQVSRKNEVEGRELPGYLLILSRRQAGKQDHNVTFSGGFFNQGGQYCPPLCTGDTSWQGGKSAGQANDPGLYLPDFLDPHRLKQRMAIRVKDIGREPGESLLLSGFQQGKAYRQIKGTNRHRIDLHRGIDLDDTRSGQLLLGWPVWYLCLLAEQIAGVNKEIRLVLFCCQPFDLECLSGQPAQLIGVSAAGFGLSLDIIGVKEEKGVRRGGVKSGGCQQDNEEDEEKEAIADGSAGRGTVIIDRKSVV